LDRAPAKSVAAWPQVLKRADQEARLAPTGSPLWRLSGSAHGWIRHDGPASERGPAVRGRGIRRLSSTLPPTRPKEDGGFAARTGRSAGYQRAGTTDPQQTAGINSAAVSSCPNSDFDRTSSNRADISFLSHTGSMLRSLMVCWTCANATIRTCELDHTRIRIVVINFCFRGSSLSPKGPRRRFRIRDPFSAEEA
jgi:hypothetical protein